MRFRGLVYRAHNPQWSWTPLSGEGSRLYGGRFNQRGVPAFYTSLAPLTAMREAQPLGRPMQPLTLYAYEINAEPLFDSTDGERRRALSVAEADLACPTWEAEMLAGSVQATQALADRLIAARYAGIQVHSFAVSAGLADPNLVLWKWGANLPTRVILIDEEGRISGGPE